MNTINAVIIDDEPDSISLLRLQLEKYCPQVKITGSFQSPALAADQLDLLMPDLVFLDIEMPGMNGFELLEKLSPFSFKVIFITAYNQYAIKAFRFNALDYLVKPADSNDLVNAVAKSAQSHAPSAMQLAVAQKQSAGDEIKKIAVSTQAGVSFISLEDIVYAEASGNYSKLILANGADFIISKTLKDIQELLEEKHFLRIHRQYIINLNRVKHFNRNDNLLLMENNAELPVARVQKEKLAEKFRWL